jgi:DNA-binding transcriptional MerR regulator/effector-binding domain-containing protein
LTAAHSVIRIGEFARIGGVSIKALRHYDAVGLLSPRRVDPVTKYRYYSIDQISRLHSLMAYRDLGLSLTLVRALLDGESDAAMLRRALSARRDELRTRVEADRAQLGRINHLLRHIDAVGRAPQYQVVIKDLGAQAVASIRSCMAAYSDVEPLLGRLTALVARSQQISGLGAVWHRCARASGGPRFSAQIDCEALAFLAGSPRDIPGCRVFELPATRVAAVVYSDVEELPASAYATIAEAVHSRGYEIAWPMREAYFRADGTPGQMVEAHFPLRRRPPLSRHRAA